MLKDVFKGAATAATVRPGPLRDWYQGLLARGMREELARVTLTRKLAAITLRLWKKGERYDPTQLTIQARERLDLEATGGGVPPPGGSRIRDEGAKGSLDRSVSPGPQSAEALA